MTERLNNSEITKRIKDANSDLQRYLNLAPSLKPIPTHSPTLQHPQQLIEPQYFKPDKP